MLSNELGDYVNEGKIQYEAVESISVVLLGNKIKMLIYANPAILLQVGMISAGQWPWS